MMPLYHCFSYWLCLSRFFKNSEDNFIFDSFISISFFGPEILPKKYNRICHFVISFHFASLISLTYFTFSYPRTMFCITGFLSNLVLSDSAVSVIDIGSGWKTKVSSSNLYRIRGIYLQTNTLAKGRNPFFLVTAMS